MSLGIAAIYLLYVHGRKRDDGQAFVAFVNLCAIGRFLVEFLRADDRGGVLALSTSQFIGWRCSRWRSCCTCASATSARARRRPRALCRPDGFAGP